MFKYFIAILAVCAGPAYAETKVDDRAVEAFEKGVSPSIEAMMFTVARARDAGFPFTGAMITVDPVDPEIFALQFNCPADFPDDACDQFQTFFQAIGGNCNGNTAVGVTCEGPEPGPPTRP